MEEGGEAYPRAKKVALHHKAVHAPIWHQSMLQKILGHVTNAGIEVAFEVQGKGVHLWVFVEVVLIAHVHEPVLLDGIAVHLCPPEERRKRILHQDMV